MKAQLIYHSGVLLENGETQIFIDVISDISKLVNPEKTIYFLVSHGHNDHFDPRIFDYNGDNVTYILSDDIKGYEDQSIMVSPHHIYYANSITINTFGSTDQGVSYMISVDGYKLIHFGDLNWWHWESDTPSAQRAEAKAFKEIVDEFKGVTIDLAFVPLDPRLKSASHYSIEYVLSTLDIKAIMPIHFAEKSCIKTDLLNKIKDQRIIADPFYTISVK